jgi:NDP-sugar pyrophosphorylase family protein
VDDAARFGKLKIRGDGRLLSFGEKQHDGPGLAYAGVTVVDRRRLLAVGRALGACSLERDLIPRLIQTDRVAAMLFPAARFVDAGTPEGWAAAERLVGAE